MTWTVPDKGEGDNDIQSIMFQEYLEGLVDGVNGTNCLVSGLAITPSAGMTLAAAKGSVLSNRTLFAVAAGNPVIGAADATNPRLDLVVVNSSGALAVRAGTAAAAPKPPARTANDVLLAVVYVPANDTTIGASQITDMRMMRTGGPLLIDVVETAVTHNTTNATQTYYTLTVPNGLLATAGRVLRVRLGGTFLMNSGSPTIQLIVAFGGTTVYDGTSSAYTADADRKAWQIEFDVIARTSASQVFVGRFRSNALAAITAPATGVGPVFSGAASAWKGASTVDADAANRDLTVQMTMSVSNAAVETVCEFAYAEIL